MTIFDLFTIFRCIRFTLYTVKKGFAVFPSPEGMSLTKLLLDGNMFPLLSLKFSLSQAGILTESF